MGKSEDNGFRGMISKYVRKLTEWWKPEPADSLFQQIVKTIFKSVAMLLLLLLSPVLLIVLVFVFFAAV